jgi:hypothetical protein
LVYTLPNELQWYDDVFYVLRKFYDERIEKRYDLIKTKYGINESVIKILREETIQDNLFQMIRSIGIKKTAKAVGSVERLIKILDFDGEDLNEFIYQYLKEEYYPDYNWGPELHDFYRNDVNEHGSYDFEVNDLFAYAYLGEWDGYDYLYALVITKWVNNGLTLLFGNKWIPVFKRWFEDNSGLEVRDIDLEGRYFDTLTEQTLRSQLTVGTINESTFFQRRIDLNKVQELIKKYAKEVFYEAESFEQFKYEVVLKAVEWIMWIEYGIGWDELPEQEEIDFVNYVSDMYKKMIKDLWRIQR